MVEGARPSSRKTFSATAAGMPSSGTAAAAARVMWRSWTLAMRFPLRSRRKMVPAGCPALHACRLVAVVEFSEKVSTSVKVAPPSRLSWSLRVARPSMERPASAIAETRSSAGNCNQAEVFLKETKPFDPIPLSDPLSYTDIPENVHVPIAVSWVFTEDDVSDAGRYSQSWKSTSMVETPPAPSMCQTFRM